MLQGILLEPMFYEGLGSLLVVIIFLVWRGKYPEEYKHTKKKLLNFLSTAHHILYFLASMILLLAIILTAVFFYSPETVIAIKTAAPVPYAFIENYFRLVWVFMLGFLFLFCLWKTIAQYHGNLDNGIIDDPDAERRFIRTDMIIQQMEKRHREEMDKWIKIVIAQGEAFKRIGERFETDPLPPNGIPERRIIVKDDPSTPVTRDELIETVLNEDVFLSAETETTEEEIAPEDIFLPQETQNKKEEIAPLAIIAKKEDVPLEEYTNLDKKVIKGFKEGFEKLFTKK